MPQLPDPSRILSRPSSVVIGELAIAAGLLGESVTIACDFPAGTLCQLWSIFDSSNPEPPVEFGVRTRR